MILHACNFVAAWSNHLAKVESEEYLSHHGRLSLVLCRVPSGLSDYHTDTTICHFLLLLSYLVY